MKDLFYLLLGVTIIVLPIYLIVRAIKNKSKKESIGKKKPVVSEQKVIKPKEKSVGKVFAILLGIIIAFVVLLVVIALIATKGKMEPINNISNTAKEIKKVLNVENEEAQEIENIFKSIGVDVIDNIEADEIFDGDEGVGSKGYRVKANFSKGNNIILNVNSENKVICIRWADKEFYRDGQELLNFSNYTMTFEEQSEYHIDAEKRIKALLKAPSTAKFPSITNWSFSKNDGSVTVQSYVDSENSYGAKIRGKFQIKYNSNKNIVSLIMDGIEYIK